MIKKLNKNIFPMYIDMIKKYNCIKKDQAVG